MRDGARNPWDMLHRINALHVIVAVNIIVFVLQYVFECFSRRVIDATGAEQFIVYGGVSVEGLARGRFWNALTYMFVHGGLLHLGANMLMVWFAGKRVLALLGTRHFLNIYFLSGLVGAGAELVIRAYAKQDIQIPIVGASACAFGLVLALAVMLPEEQITAMIYFVFPVRLKLWTMAMIMLSTTVALGLFFLFFYTDSEGARMANFAHLGGAVTGWYYMRLIGYGGRPMTYERLWSERAGGTFSPRPEMARARRRRLAAEMDIDMDSVKPHDPSADLMRDEVDPILEKISEQGMSSLTDEERRILERASREISLKSRPRKP